MVDWINENKEWLFSGIAIAIPLAILGWFIASKKNHKQTQKGGKGSTNLQAGGSINIKKNEKSE